MDKAIEQQRARSINRRLPTGLRDLGFKKGAGGSCVRVIDGHLCRVGLQKFVHRPAFRVILSFEPGKDDGEDYVVEFSDLYTYKDSPSGRKYNFGIRWGDDAVERCIAEIHDFVENVGLAWFAKQARGFAVNGSST